MEESKRPKGDALSQQKMRAFQPIHTLQSTLLIFIAASLVFLFFGSIFCLQATCTLYLVSTEISVRYDQLPQCRSHSECEFPLSIEKPILPPVYIYYELGNFYQNYRQYVKSRDNKQLFGVEVDTNSASSPCSPVVTMGDVGRNVSAGGYPLSPEAVANPCGLVAKSVFNGESYADTYSLFHAFGQRLLLNESGISWRSDTKYVFNHPLNFEQVQWMDVENEHFQVWMRTALLPTFRKLWAHYDSPLPAGNYTVKVQNNYPVEAWQGTKGIVIATATSLGGNTRFFGYLLLAGAAACWVVIVAFIMKNGLKAKPDTDDLLDLHWD